MLVAHFEHVIQAFVTDGAYPAFRDRVIGNTMVPIEFLRTTAHSTRDTRAQDKFSVQSSGRKG